MLTEMFTHFYLAGYKLYNYGTYTVSVKIKREMVLLPNDEEVASSKKTYPSQD